MKLILIGLFFLIVILISICFCKRKKEPFVFRSEGDSDQERESIEAQLIKLQNRAKRVDERLQYIDKVFGKHINLPNFSSGEPYNFIDGENQVYVKDNNYNIYLNDIDLSVEESDNNFEHKEYMKIDDHTDHNNFVSNDKYEDHAHNEYMLIQDHINDNHKTYFDPQLNTFREEEILPIKQTIKSHNQMNNTKNYNLKKNVEDLNYKTQKHKASIQGLEKKDIHKQQLLSDLKVQSESSIDKLKENSNQLTEFTTALYKNSFT